MRRKKQEKEKRANCEPKRAPARVLCAAQTNRGPRSAHSTRLDASLPPCPALCTVHCHPEYPGTCNRIAFALTAAVPVRVLARTLFRSARAVENFFLHLLLPCPSRSLNQQNSLLARRVGISAHASSSSRQPTSRDAGYLLFSDGDSPRIIASQLPCSSRAAHVPPLPWVPTSVSTLGADHSTHSRARRVAVCPHPGPPNTAVAILPVKWTVSRSSRRLSLSLRCSTLRFSRPQSAAHALCLA